MVSAQVDCARTAQVLAQDRAGRANCCHTHVPLNAGLAALGLSRLTIPGAILETETLSRPALHLARGLPQLQRPVTPSCDDIGRVIIAGGGEFLDQAEVALAVVGEEAI